MRSARPQSAMTARLLFFATIGCIAGAYLLRLGQGSLWDNSEPTYGEIVKEIFRTRDWLTLHFDYAAWFVHPPLWFWTAAASVSAIGLNEFALRLPSAIFGVLCAVATYRAAARMYGPYAAPIAALAVGTSLEFFVLARLAILDTMLVFFTTLAVYWSYFALTHGDRRAFWIAVVSAALGTMTKGPVAAALPVLILLVYATWARAWSLLWRLPLLRGLLVYAVVAGAWFAFEAHLHGGAFVNEYFVRSTVGRALSPFENQPGPWWYYAPVVLAGFFPFVVFLPWSIWIAAKHLGSDERFLFAAALAPLAFFSLVQTKLPNYIAVIFPALGILVGGAFAKSVTRQRHAVVFAGLGTLVAVLAAAVGYAGTSPLAHTRYASFSLPLELLVLSMGVCALTGFVALAMWKRIWIAPAALTVMMLIFVGFATTSILPRLEAFKPMKGMAASVMSRWRAGELIGAYGVHGEYSLLFYTSDGPLWFLGTAPGGTPPDRFFSLRRPKLTVVSTDNYDELVARGMALRVLRRDPSMLLVAGPP
jgi:4-amino-4-deoxy-L-arabinose transferase-like glycosyltransferase